MIHRFAHFEIDEATREVRAGKRVLTLQPRVFDLLVYLAKNRDRVVLKDELLDAVWPDVTVADGSLQRAVSLARNALEAAGAETAIRTYSRQGYRFCAELPAEATPPPPPTAQDSSALAAPREAYAAGDWSGVMASYEAISTIDNLARQAPWAEGEAWHVLGDILVARGDFAGAEAAFLRSTELGGDAHYNIALLRFAEGDSAAASRLLAHALTENAWSCRSKRGQALAYFAIVATAAGRLDDARNAIAELEADPDLTSTPALQALLGRARAELAAAEGRTTEALNQFRTAIRISQTIQAPLLAAQLRCRLAGFLAGQGDREAALMELTAAAPVLEEAGAAGLLSHCAKVRSLLNPGPPS